MVQVFERMRQLAEERGAAGKTLFGQACKRTPDCLHVRRM